ncbi:MAG: hypothetical protein JSU86_01970 [Phycisphaerales bacterium]|nr:MAG: hypothetical protein JSU86_01970 [Phycisphaerales bacterium]
MNKAIFLVLGLGMIPAAAYALQAKGDELTDPLEILKKADAAAKAVESVKYKVSYKGRGAAGAQAPTIEGTVLMDGWFESAPDKFLCEANVKQPGSSEVRIITAGSDTRTFYVIDHQAKVAYVDVFPRVMGSIGRPALSLRMVEFVHPSPFSHEINSRKQELRGTKKIGGEDCYEVYVVYTNRLLQAIWYFSKKNFLPRSVIRRQSGPSGERLEEQWTLTDVVVDPDVGKDPFKLRLPAGYTQSHDPAP